MNPESFFETTPWQYAHDRITNGDLGSIIAVGVQEILPVNSIDTRIEFWKAQFCSLFDGEEAVHKLENRQTISMLMRYPGPVLIRLFLEQQDHQPVSNFEVVGTKALLVWKQDGFNLATVNTAGETEISFGHPYAVTLGQQR